MRVAWRKVGRTAAAVVAFLGGATVTTMLFRGENPADGRSTRESGHGEEVTEDVEPVETSCSLFTSAVESGEPIADVVRRFGLPEHVRVPEDASVGTVLCTATADGARDGQITGVGIVDQDTRQLWLALGPGAASWSDADWDDYLGANGFPDAVRHPWGYTTASVEDIAAAPTGMDLWQVMDRDLPPSP